MRRVSNCEVSLGYEWSSGFLNHGRAIPKHSSYYESVYIWLGRSAEGAAAIAFILLSGTIVLTDDLEELLVGLRHGASLKGQVEAEPANETEEKSPEEDGAAGAKMRISGAGDLSTAEIKSPGADDPAVSDAVTDKPGADNEHILKYDWLLRIVFM